MRSDASKEHSGTFKELEQKRGKIKKKIRQCLKEHKGLDGRKPKERERKQQLAQASETLKKHFDKIDQFLKTAAPRMGQGKKPAEIKSNITDNESAKMTTSKGTIQGYNGVAAVDKKHQVIVDAQAFGAGQEQHTLKPVLDSIRERYRRTPISDDILAAGVIITADTGFSSEENNDYIKEEGVNAYIPDNQFRSRDKAFKDQKVRKAPPKGGQGAAQGYPGQRIPVRHQAQKLYLPGRQGHVAKLRRKYIQGQKETAL
ncbi:transposase, partial [Microbulbifer taiwanensis]